MNIFTFTENLLVSCDIIGSEPRFRLGTAQRNQTLWGGLLCLATYVLLAIAFLYFGQEFYYKQNPNVIYSNLPNDGSAPINLNNDRFSFIIAIKDRDSKYVPMDSSYVNVEMNLVKASRPNDAVMDQMSNETISTQTGKLTVNNCGKIDNRQSLFKLYNLSNFACLQPNQNLTINGTIQHNVYQFLNINISSCSNSTALCQPEDVIKKRLSGAKLEMAYVDIMLNQQNFTTMESFIVQEYVTPIIYDEYSIVTLELSPITYKTDAGYLISDLYYTYFFQKYNIYQVGHSLKDSNTIVSFNIAQSRIQKVIYRKYYKVQNLLAEIGGLAKSFIIIAMVLNYFHDEAKYYEKLVDELFDVEDLYKYFQYYKPNNKQIFKKYRDSIFLKNSKAIENIKLERHGGRSTLVHLKNNFTGLNNEQILRSKEPPSIIGNNGHQIKTHPTSSLANEGKMNGNKNPFERDDEIREIEVADVQPSENISQSSIESNPHSGFIETLRKSNKLKENFYKLKKKRFSLTAWELLRFSCCPRKSELVNKKYILSGGRDIIFKRTDIIYVMKRFLEFDRFKNLMLKDYQLILLNSLSKFMLDPERINLVDFENCNFDKMIDSYGHALSNNSVIDANLCAWIKSKFHMDVNSKL